MRVFDDARAAEIETRTVRVRDRLRVDGGTAHGALSMGGITKTYGAACSPEVALIRVDARIRAVHAAVYGLAPGDVFSGWDAIGTTGTDAVRRRGACAPATARAEYEALTGSKFRRTSTWGSTRTAGAWSAAWRTCTRTCPAASSRSTSSPPSRGGATLVVAPGAYAGPSARPGTLLTCRPDATFASARTPGTRRSAPSGAPSKLPRVSDPLAVAHPHGNKLADPGVDARLRRVRRVAGARARDRRGTRRSAGAQAQRGPDGRYHRPLGDAGARVYRGSHYSNGQKRTRVLYNAENPPPLPPDLLERIEECF